MGEAFKPTDQNLRDFLVAEDEKLKKSNEALAEFEAAIRANQSRSSSPDSNQNPLSASAKKSKSEKEPKPKRKINPRVIKAVAWVSLASVGVGVVGYMTNFSGLQDSVNNATNGAQEWVAENISNHGAASLNNLKTTAVEGLGVESLGPRVCGTPEAVVAVATVSAEMPLVPLFKYDAAPDTVVPYPTYMNSDTQKSLKDSAEQEKFGKLITTDSYTHTALVDMKFGVTMCEIPGKTAISTQGDDYTVKQAAINVQFVPYYSLFDDITIDPVYQLDKLENMKLDASKNENFVMPASPTLYIGKSTPTDVKFDTSLEELKASLAKPEQQQILRSMMETAAVEAMFNPVESAGKLQLVGGGDLTITKYLAKALMRQIAGRDSSDKDTFDDSGFPYSAYIPNDPITKAPVTANDANGVSPLTNVDPNQDIIINKMTLEIGKLEAPQQSTPTPTDSPTTDIASK